jgi:hypothetical protein
VADLAWALVVLATVAGAALLLRDPRTVPCPPGRLDRPRSLSVVVPARDEEQTLPALLASLGRLDGPPVEVLVVDDDSQDATAAVARAGGARVLAAGARPPGWTGKAWACHVGARGAGGDLLLFLDADTRLAPAACAGLLELHDRHGGLVSVQPFHAPERGYEQLSSYFNVIALLASSAFTGAASPAQMAFGPCLLTSREDYELAGGHAAVRAEILDDVSLAAAYRRAGLPVRCFLGGTAVRMRSYPGGLRQLAAGWTKNVASGASAAPLPASVGAGAWVAAHHAVAVGALLAALEAASGRSTGLSSGHPALWALSWVVVAWQLRSFLRRAGSFRWWTWALFPLPLLAFDVLFALSAARTVVGRSVSWRGREVDLRRRESPGGG